MRLLVIEFCTHNYYGQDTTEFFNKHSCTKIMINSSGLIQEIKQTKKQTGELDLASQLGIYCRTCTCI